VVQGKGRTKKGAIGEAWRNAMLQTIQGAMPAADFAADESPIDTYLVENWRRYVEGDPHKVRVLKQYSEDTGWITIQAQIKKDMLLSDIEEKFTRVRRALKSAVVALLPDPDWDRTFSGEAAERDAMFDTLYAALRGKMTVHNLKAIRESIHQEGNALGVSQQSDPTAYLDAKFPNVKVVLYLSLSLTSQADPVFATDRLWSASIDCRAVLRESGQELWRLQVKSGPTVASASSYVIGEHEARSRAVQNVARAVGSKIEEELGKQ
jgi:hypothetical protein